MSDYFSNAIILIPIVALLLFLFPILIKITLTLLLTLQRSYTKLVLKYSYKRKRILRDEKHGRKPINAIITATYPPLFLVKLVLYLNLFLISAITNILSEKNNVTPSDRASNSIVGLMLGEKAKNSSITQISLMTCLLIHLTLVFFSLVSFSIVLFMAIVVGIVAIQADQKLIDYRVRKGWYGSNEFEAKEIINFILSHSNKDDFNDSGTLKKVIPLPNIEAELSKHKEHGGVSI